MTRAEKIEEAARLLIKATCIEPEHQNCPPMVYLREALALPNDQIDLEETAMADHRAMLAAVQVLRDVEWSEREVCCPVCHGWCPYFSDADGKPYPGHAPDCKLAAVIRG